MISIHQALETSRSRSQRIYRWVAAWLIAGAAIALLLLANSILDYRFVSRLLAVAQVRHRMGQQAATAEQLLRRYGARVANLNSLMTEADRPKWAELRGPDGIVLEHAGEAGQPLFSRDEEHQHLMRHDPLYKVVNGAAGPVVVEVFPMHLGGPAGPAATSSPLTSAAPHAPPVLEIAMPLSSVDAAVFRPIRKNLLLNCTAALSLLATVVLAGLGFRSYARGRRLEEQLGIARQVQSELLPSLGEAYDGVHLATEYTPAEQVGGDFYDVFRVQGKGVALVMGDVSGKGIPAALLMGVIHGAVRSSGWSESAARHAQESELLNQLLCERASRERYASMFWCCFDRAAGCLRYINAGHCPPLLRRMNGHGISRLEVGGPVLGILPGAQYQQAVHAVESGDVLIMYSDGLVEATNPAGEEYGEARLRDLMAKVAATDAEAVRQEILASLAEFTGAVPLQDDLTLVVAQFKPLANSESPAASAS